MVALILSLNCHTMGVHFMSYNERNILDVISTPQLLVISFTKAGRAWNASLSNL